MEQTVKDLGKMMKIWLGIAILTIPVHLAVNYYYPKQHQYRHGDIIIVAGIVLFGLYFRNHYEIRLK